MTETKKAFLLYQVRYPPEGIVTSPVLVVLATSRKEAIKKVEAFRGEKHDRIVTEEMAQVLLVE